MRTLLLLLLSALTATAAVSPPAPAPTFGSRTKFTATYEQFTNAAYNASSGDWIIVPPGPTFVVPTNTTTLLTAGVNYEFYPDVVFGTFGDTTARPLFTEAAVATTNTIIFRRSVIVSNQTSKLVALTNALSRIYFFASRAWRAGTSTACAVFEQAGGYFFWRVGEMQNDGYDGYWAQGASVHTYGEAGRILAADTALEFSAAVTGEVHIKAGLVQRTQHAHFAVHDDRPFIADFGGKVTLDIDTADPGTNGVITIGGHGGGEIGTYRIRRIRGDNSKMNATTVVNLQNVGRLIGARIDGPNFNVAPVDASFLTNEFVLENCSIYPGASATESIANFASLDVPIRVVGSLYIADSKPINIANSIYGDPITGPAYTNSYAGTNVTWNIGGHSQQTLDATNGMLLILTNSAGLLSEKTSTLTMYNNKATNMPIAITTASRRFFGPDAALLNGANSLTNARSIVFEATKIGTNIMLTVTHQR